MNEWQPIETAPEDIEVLLYCEYGIIIGAWLTENLYLHEPAWVDMGSSQYAEEYGWQIVEPTHWMPLPEPPK